MTPETKNAPDAVQGVEGNGTTTHEGRRTMHHHTDYAHFEPQDDTQRTSPAEYVGNLLLIALAMLVTYLAVVGAVHTLIGLGVAA